MGGARFLCCIRGVFLVLTCSQRRTSRRNSDSPRRGRVHCPRPPTPAGRSPARVDIPPPPGTEALPAFLLLVQTCPGGDAPLGASCLIRSACLGPGWGSTRPGAQGSHLAASGHLCCSPFPLLLAGVPGAPAARSAVGAPPAWGAWRPGTQAKGLAPPAGPQLARRRRLPVIPSSP